LGRVVISKFRSIATLGDAIYFVDSRIGTISVKLIIFDFDGTLVDSRKLIIESHRVVFGQFGLALPSEDESLSLIGMSLELVLLQLAGPDAPVEKMVATYQRLLPLLRADEPPRGRPGL
jgi:phosphoglycolate phosphatase